MLSLFVIIMITLTTIIGKLIDSNAADGIWIGISLEAMK